MAAGLTLLAQSSLYAAPAAPQDLSPSGPWVVDYADESCRLLRRFGEGDQSLTIAFIRYRPDLTFDLTISGNPLASKDYLPWVTVWFGPEASAFKVKTMAVTYNQVSSVFLSDFALVSKTTIKQAHPISPASEQDIDVLTLDRWKGPSLAVRLGPMDKPMRALRGCMDDLVRHWGLDPTQQAALKRPATPLGKPGAWLRSSDYPADAVNRKRSGSVRYRLSIDAMGAVSECHIQGATQLPDFAATTCRVLIERARFTPALDSEGRPIASYYNDLVDWNYTGR